MTAKVNLEQALWKAQRSIQGVGKDGNNAYSKYRYTSAEAMLSACRNALHDAGLTVRRTTFTYDEKLHVSSTIRLSHYESGESEESVIMFPAIEQKGKPQDKAIAAALTGSLSYYLRDLLLLPRSEDFDMDKRDDTEYNPQQIKSPPPQRIALFSDVPAKLNSLRSIIDQNDCLLEVLSEFQVSEIGSIKLTDAQRLKKFIDHVKPRPSTDEIVSSLVGGEVDVLGMAQDATKGK